MDNKQSLEDKPTTNAAAEEILSDEELDSVAGGGGTGSGYSVSARDMEVAVMLVSENGGTGRG